MNQMPKKSQEFNKVAECLYRNGNRLYYALVKVNGKQIRRSLKTTDLAIAKRRLGEFRAKAERLEGEENRNIRFEELADDRCRRQTTSRRQLAKARQSATELSLELPTPAPGTAIYIRTEGLDHQTLVLLRAFVRAAERGGHRVKLLP